MANKRQTKSIIAGSTRVLRPQKPTDGHVPSKTKVIAENEGTTASPEKIIEAINNKEQNDKVPLPGKRVKRTLAKAPQVAVTRKNPVRTCRMGEAKTK
ncbi:hypothetical protein AgCh_036755 [Apium graveolens]